MKAEKLPNGKVHYIYTANYWSAAVSMLLAIRDVLKDNFLKYKFGKDSQFEQISVDEQNTHVVLVSQGEYCIPVKILYGMKTDIVVYTNNNDEP